HRLVDDMSVAANLVKQALALVAIGKEKLNVAKGIGARGGIDAVDRLHFYTALVNDAVADEDDVGQAIDGDGSVDQHQYHDQREGRAQTDANAQVFDFHGFSANSIVGLGPGAEMACRSFHEGKLVVHFNNIFLLLLLRELIDSPITPGKQVQLSRY